MKEFVKAQYQKHGQKLRFGIVGIANTALDFALLFLFVNLGLGVVLANILSTGTAFTFSFFVNRSFTFKHTGGNKLKQFILFIIVTLFGLWVLQPIVILAITALLAPFMWDAALVLFVAKLLATVVSLIWNYLLYSRLIFTHKESDGSHRD